MMQTPMVSYVNMHVMLERHRVNVKEASISNPYNPSESQVTSLLCKSKGVDQMRNSTIEFYIGLFLIFNSNN